MHLQFETELSESPRSHEIELMRNEFSKFLHSVRNGEEVILDELAIRTTVDETGIKVIADDGHEVASGTVEAEVIAKTDAYLYGRFFRQ